MATKKTIRIDREKCVGCGQCVNACPGGALQMVDGKAALVREDFCDGLGVCIGECPVDAIKFEEVEVADNQHPAVPAATTAPAHGHHGHGGGCPGHTNVQFDRPATPVQPAAQPATHAGKSPCGCPSHANQQFDRPAPVAAADTPSALGAWPIQLHLVQPAAPQFQNADVLVAASCSAFTCGGFHQKLLAGKGLVIACPKLDEQEGYMEKLTALFANAGMRSITVARLEVPCCAGLTRLVLAARAMAGSELPVTEVTIGLKGDIVAEKTL